MLLDTFLLRGVGLYLGSMSNHVRRVLFASLSPPIFGKTENTRELDQVGPSSFPNVHPFLVGAGRAS
jgi:hypothetical protein